MPNRTYKREELVGVSATSTDAAIQNALARASQTLLGFRVLSPEELQR